MNYSDPELRDRLSAEYVLGTLSGPARRRFERLMAKDPFLRRTVHGWEQNLAPMVSEVPERQPPRRVWRRVRSQIRAARPGWQVLMWPAATAVAIAVLAVAVLIRPPATVAPDYVAIIADEAGQPRWSVAAVTDAGRLRIRAVAPASVPEGKSLELWLLPEESGAGPESLGLLPRDGERLVSLSADQADPESLAPGLAVSLEPAGGSPTGQPTGPILYQARLVPM
jgi:anti-sigma-K factor RskA